MFKTLGRILGSGDVVSKGIDLIDSFHTSPTELIDVKAKAKAALLTAYAPFKIAQRFLTITFTSVYLSAFVLCLAMMLTGWGDVSGVKELMSEFYLSEIEFTIVVFYFGGGFIEGGLKARQPKEAT